MKLVWLAPQWHLLNSCDLQKGISKYCRSSACYVEMLNGKISCSCCNDNAFKNDPACLGGCCKEGLR